MRCVPHELLWISARVRLSSLLALPPPVLPPVPLAELRGTIDRENTRKPKGHLTWVSARDNVPAEVRLYDHLFMHEDPSEVEDWLGDMNPNSLVIRPNARIDISVAGRPERHPCSPAPPRAFATRHCPGRTARGRDTVHRGRPSLYGFQPIRVHSDAGGA